MSVTQGLKRCHAYTGWRRRITCRIKPGKDVDRDRRGSPLPVCASGLSAAHAGICMKAERPQGLGRQCGRRRGSQASSRCWGRGGYPLERVAHFAAQNFPDITFTTLAISPNFWSECRDGAAAMTVASCTQAFRSILHDTPSLRSGPAQGDHPILPAIAVARPLLFQLRT